MSVAVSARSLTKSYRDGAQQIEVLQGLDLEITSGEIIAIVGPSGSGKSTLLHVLGGLDGADAGSVRIGEVDILGLEPAPQAEFRRRNVGFVFQFHELLPDFNALENVMMPGRIAGWRTAPAWRRAQALLDEVDLGTRRNHFPSELSGGERQRVALCRALFLSPALLLADEPTGNLDPESGDRVFDLLLGLGRRHRTTAVVVTHNPSIAKRCGRVLELVGGRLQEVP